MKIMKIYIKISLPYLLILILFLLFIIQCKSKYSSYSPEPLDREQDNIENEFETEEDSSAAYVNGSWAEWIKENHYPLQSLTSSNYEDLQFLKDKLLGANIVQLGESGHGVKEYNLAKVRLIKFLYEELGFNVIAFESSLFDCYYVNENMDDFTAIDAMYNSIYKVWHTHEVLSLFEYIKETQNRADPLILAGIDMKSSGQAYKYRPEFLKYVISRLDPDYASEVYDLDKNMTDNISTVYWMNYIRSNPDSLKTEYDKATIFFENNINTLISLFPEDPQIPLIAQRVVYCIPKEIEHYQENCNGIYPRDPAMADNLDFLMEKIYPGEKMIVWAHNSHIRHDNQAVQNSHGFKTMGTWISERHSSELYTVGLYMYRGQAAYNSRSAYNIGPPTPNSIESIFYTVRRKYTFVNMKNIESTTGTSWISSKIGAYAWGLFLEFLIPNKQYDGILFIDTVHPPDYTN